MSVFQAYEKVERIEKEECSGLLEGTSYIFEKLDGANAQLYLDSDSGDIAFGSRNHVVGIGSKLLLGDTFRGFSDWVGRESEKIKKEFFLFYPGAIVYGEWLVKHSVQYDNKYYGQFYAFDVKIDDQYQHFYAPAFKCLVEVMPVIPVDAVVKDCTIADLKQYLDLPSHYGAAFREGIVIKNYNFINKYGRTPYGKLLHKDFAEVKAKAKPKVNPDDIEVELTRLYCTKARTIKICNKIRDKENNARLEMKHIPQVINMLWYDIVTEDMHDLLKKFRNPTIDFKKFQRLVFDASKTYYQEFLQEQA